MTRALERLHWPTPFRTLTHDLRDRYAVERELGRDGMATVYLARDPGPDRFRREIALAARPRHPHICSVYDSCETTGSLRFTMPFVQGESLRDRLRRDARLPPHEALRIPARPRRRCSTPTITA